MSQETVKKQELKDSAGGDETICRSHSEFSRSRADFTSEKKSAVNSTSAPSALQDGVKNLSWNTTSHRRSSLSPSSRFTTSFRTLVDDWTLLSPEPGLQGESQKGSQTGPQTGSQIGPETESETESEAILQTANRAFVPSRIDPPHPSKKRYEWVWFPDGYCAEREMIELPRDTKSKTRATWKSRIIGASRRTNKSNQQELAGLKVGSFSNPTIVPRTRQQYSHGSGRELSLMNKSNYKIQSSKLRRSLQYMSPSYPHFLSPDGEPEGLYCKTKRSIGVGGISTSKGNKHFDLLPPVNEHDTTSESRAQTTLEGTTIILDQLQKYSQAQARLPVPADGRLPSLDLQTCPKRLGFMHRNRTESTDTLLSVGSSLRDLFMSKTPDATPNSESQYSGWNGKSYMKVDISKSCEPTFLPSEARRVSTPPVRSHKTQACSDRGFFFGLSPPRSEESKSEVDATESHQTPSATLPALHDDLTAPSIGERHWWDKPMAANRAMRVFDPQDIALDVPEHLPSSPLCPMSSLHKSGGNGICAYHGRKKTNVEANKSE